MMRAKEYHVLDRCVNEGVEWGWQRAHKHQDDPSPEVIRDEIANGVLNIICEWFDFDDNLNYEV